MLFFESRYGHECTEYSRPKVKICPLYIVHNGSITFWQYKTTILTPKYKLFFFHLYWKSWHGTLPHVSSLQPLKLDLLYMSGPLRLLVRNTKKKNIWCMTASSAKYHITFCFMHVWLVATGTGQGHRYKLLLNFPYRLRPFKFRGHLGSSGTQTISPRSLVLCWERRGGSRWESWCCVRCTSYSIFWSNRTSMESNAKGAAGVTVTVSVFVLLFRAPQIEKSFTVLLPAYYYTFVILLIANITFENGLLRTKLTGTSSSSSTVVQLQCYVVCTILAKLKLELKATATTTTTNY